MVLSQWRFGGKSGRTLLVTQPITAHAYKLMA